MALIRSDIDNCVPHLQVFFRHSSPMVMFKLLLESGGIYVAS